eukprot:gene8087-14003_t
MKLDKQLLIPFGTNNIKMIFEYYREAVSLLVFALLRVSMKDIASWVLILLSFTLLPTPISSQTLNATNCSLVCPNSRLVACKPHGLPVLVNLGVSDREVCHRHKDCYGGSSEQPVPVQQRPINILLGQSVTLKLDQMLATMSRVYWQLYNVSSRQFTSCDVSRNSSKLIANITQTGSVVFNSTFYGVGVFYLAGEANNILTCSLGLRIKIIVKAHNCPFVGGSVCAGSGICIANANDTMAKCTCCPGYNGTDCGEYNGCFSNPCFNAGNCSDVTAGLKRNFTCSCSPFFTGKRCESRVDYCEPMPCLNNATCNNLVLEKNYSCNCPAGFTGRNCEINIDDCINNNCTRNSTCIDLVNGYRCKCNGNWTGNFCEIDVNECNTKPCRNNATCINTPGSFSCLCPVNVTGLFCETDLYDNCASNPCLNKGVCTDLVGGYSCRCAQGYTGSRCQSDVNECLSNPCSAEGSSRCVNSPGNFLCVCLTEYTGKLCENLVNRCVPSPCLHGGLCVNIFGGYTCVCPAGYQGKNCEDILNKCHYKPCKNNATCEQTGDFLSNYTCHCLPGWTGRNCTDDYNECLSSPCLNGGRCINKFNSFECVCDVGWYGTQCQINYNACQVSPCKNNATCTDLPTGLDYSCTCVSGFTGQNCSINVDDCVRLRANCNNGVCVDQVGSYYCNCSKGWYGKSCDTDRDMCASRPCLNSAVCENKNTTLGYDCHCGSGWTGVNCETNVNDCISNPCMNGATCNDYLNYYNCSCLQGYTGRHCETEINECQSQPCRNNATCVNEIGRFTCNCLPGYTGHRCETNTNECASNPCFNNATCIDEINAYTCRCKGGYLGFHCEIPKCRTNPCRHGATCVQMPERYSCQCLPGYTGQNCEKEINECSSNPCQNNATCLDQINRFQCNCASGFTGTACETHLCDTNVCKNGASCQRTPEGYTCSCLNGFTGQACSQNINECLSNPCSENGTLNCTDLVGGYRCYCKAGFLGTRCENHTCDVLKPCRNGAVCLRLPGGYQCVCRPGFTGADCQVNINECASSPCLHGTCIDSVNGYLCNCSSMYTGVRCETNMDSCVSSPCLNNATCTSNLTTLSYTCSCPGGYTGHRCENHLCDAIMPCRNNATCLKLPNNYSCLCPSGFTGNQCENDINECNSSPCLNKGSCLNKQGSFACICPRNFTGPRCETFVDYCSPNPCNNGSCRNNYTAQTYNCSCPPAFLGKQCQIHICDIQDPCKNGATCIRALDRPICNCQPGFSGPNCSVNINECASDPCLNNGTCSDLTNSFICSCSSRYTGALCETAVNFCSPNPCRNSGSCQNDWGNGTYRCICQPNTSGRNCESVLGPCFSSPCLNNGKCNELSSGTFNCSCPFGFNGTRCESLACPCQNNGRCGTFGTTVKCICPNDYGGLFCQDYYGDCRNNQTRKCIDDTFCVLGTYGYTCQCPGHLSGDPRCNTLTTCTPSPCLNNATCRQNGFLSLACNCPAGYAGQFCQFDINECASTPCLNGGQCREVGIGSFACYCKQGYVGTLCQNRSASLSSSLFVSLGSTFYVPAATSAISNIRSATFITTMAMSSQVSTPAFSVTHLKSSYWISTQSSLVPSADIMTNSQSNFVSSLLTSTKYQSSMTTISSSLLTSAKSNSFVVQTLSMSSSAERQSLTSVARYSTTIKTPVTFGLSYSMSSLQQRTSAKVTFSVARIFSSTVAANSVRSLSPSLSTSMGQTSPLDRSASIQTSIYLQNSASSAIMSRDVSSSVVQRNPSAAATTTPILSTYMQTAERFMSFSSDYVNTASSSMQNIQSGSHSISSVYFPSSYSTLIHFTSSPYIHSPVSTSPTVTTSLPLTAKAITTVLGRFSIQSSAQSSLPNYATSSTSLRFTTSAAISSPSQGPSFLVSTRGSVPSFVLSSTQRQTAQQSLESSTFKDTASGPSSSTKSLFLSLVDSSSSQFSSSFMRMANTSTSLKQQITYPPWTSSASTGFSVMLTTQSKSLNSSDSSFTLPPSSFLPNTTSRAASSLQPSRTLTSHFPSPLSAQSRINSSYLLLPSSFLSNTTSRAASSLQPSRTLTSHFPIPLSTQSRINSSFLLLTSSFLSSTIISAASSIQSSKTLPSHFSSPVFTQSRMFSSVKLSSVGIHPSPISTVDTRILTSLSLKEPPFSSSVVQTQTQSEIQSDSRSDLSIQPSSAWQSSAMPTSTMVRNPCTPNPCQQGGNCTRTSSQNFNCTCPLGYGGQRCESLACQCKNNGRCVRDSVLSNFRCICKVGFSGAFCQTRVADCRTENCSGHGICTERLQGFVCECSGGYFGKNCQSYSNNCVPNPCQNSGICRTRSNATGGGFSSLYGSVDSSLGLSSTVHSTYASAYSTGTALKTEKPANTHSAITSSSSPLFTSVSSFSNTFSSPRPTVSVAIQSGSPAPTISNTLKSNMTAMLSQASKQFASSYIDTYLSSKPTSNFPSQSMSGISSLSKELQPTYQTVTTTKSDSPMPTFMRTETTTLPSPSQLSTEIGASSSFQRNASVFFPSSPVPSSFSLTSSSILPGSVFSSISPLSSKLTATSILGSSSTAISMSKISSSAISDTTFISASPVNPSPSQSSMYLTSSAIPTTSPPSNITCADRPCNGYPCFNDANNGNSFRCQCGYPSFGPRCIEGITIHFPYFNGHSFVEYAPIRFNEVVNTIVMTFRTTNSNGVLLYAGHQTYIDFILIRIVNGYVEFRFDAGAGVVTITSQSRVDNGNLVTIKASHDSRYGAGSLAVNSSVPISRSSNATFKSIELSTSWFLGGINKTFRPVNSSAGLPSFSSLVGCIRDLQVNSKPYRIIDAINWSSISECDIPACQRGPCRNNATCVQNKEDMQRYTCQCGVGYFGNDCTERVAHCNGDPCNGGTCVWTPTGRICLCQFGRHGPSCLSSLNITNPVFSQVYNYSSYIQYPWQQTMRNADERFEIQIQFRGNPNDPNSHKNGLLVYAAQSSIGATGDDFFAVGIVSNYTYMIYNLGSGVATARSLQVIDPARTWHLVVAGRNKRSGYIYTDNQTPVYVTSPGLLTGLDVYTPLFIGGVPDLSKLPSIVRAYFQSGFVGTISNAYFRTTESNLKALLTNATGNVTSASNGVPIERGLNIGDDSVSECVPNPCQNNGTCSQNGGQFVCNCPAGWSGVLCQDRRIPCVDYNPCAAGSICQSNANGISCDCQLGRIGQYCHQRINITQPFFKANSFMAFKSPNVKYLTKVNLRFKPAKLNGLLFYISENTDSTSGDFFTISLWNGYVYVRFNLGLGLATMRSRNTVKVGQWHELYVERRLKQAIMRLDSNMYIGVRGSGSYTQLNVGSVMYLGGLPRLSAMNIQAVKDVNSQRDFEGTVSRFIVNDVVTVFSSTKVGRNIEDVQRTCVLNECKNNALCSIATVRSPHPYTCSCTLGWQGSLCNSAIPRYAKARFSGDGYIFFQDNITTPSTDNHIEFTVNTTSDGLILWLGELRSSKRDYFSVGIKNSRLRLSIDTGNGLFQFHDDKNISDGQPHKVIITRISFGSFASIAYILNGFTPVLRSMTSSDQALDTSGHIYIGGLDGDVVSLSRGQYRTGLTGCLWDVRLRNALDLNKNQYNRGMNVRACS